MSNQAVEEIAEKLIHRYGAVGAIVALYEAACERWEECEFAGMVDTALREETKDGRKDPGLPGGR